MAFVNCIPVMTSNTAPNGVASCSSFFPSDGGYNAYKAFDHVYGSGAGGTCWCSNGTSTGQLGYEFSSAKTIVSYAITIRSTSGDIGQAPTAWTFETYVGGSWVTVDARSSISWVLGERKVFLCASANTATAHRLNITANNGASYVAIAELEMSEGAGLDDQYTVSLMHFDGNLNDESGKTWTAYGGATTSAAAAKFGSGGLYCPVASSSYLKGPSLTLGGQDFCIEGFASLGSASARWSRISDFGNGQQNDNIIISKTDSQSIHAYLIDGTTTVWDSPDATISYDTMFHYALSYVHSTGTWRFFVGGSLIGTTTHTWNRRTLTLNYYGKSNWSIDDCYSELKLDEPRISDGNARYTANFTPPTAPFGSQSIWLPQPIIFF